MSPWLPLVRPVQRVSRRPTWGQQIHDGLELNLLLASGREPACDFLQTIPEVAPVLLTPWMDPAPSVTRRRPLLHIQTSPDPHC